MSQSGAPKKVATESERVATGGYADVWLFGEALSGWKAVCGRRDDNSRRAARRVEAYFVRFATHGMTAFTDETFKTVGRVKADGGNEHLLYEFKSYQFRLYGVIREYRGKRSFLGVGCDPAKKNNKADQRILRRAANAADKI